jgi:Pyrimidine dimer DNA glycosylase
MRLWSLHPKHLDRAGLVALWREALLAQAVLRGRTRGYRHHPQLDRFRVCRCPVAAIATYLRVVHREAYRRGYCFDASRIARARTTMRLTVTRGQVAYEWKHLQRRLKRRSARRPNARVPGPSRPTAHPLFRVVPGPTASWERIRG